MEYLSPKDGVPLQSIIFRGALCLSLLLSCTVTSASPAPTVRVLVERDRGGISIQGFDLVVTEADTGRKVLHAAGRSQVSLQCSLGSKMRLRHFGDLEVSKPVRVVSMGGFIRVGSSQYRDDLYVYSFNGDCVVVNHVDIEKYVAGLLNSEMSAKWSLPTLKAQAVAARTYAIHQMMDSSGVKYRSIKPFFDVHSTVRDQVYEGAHQERYRTLKAVEETRGQILTYEGKPIKAFYHSTCGGFTEAPERVWGTRFSYMEPVRCGFCEKSPRYSWVYSITAAELARKLQAQRLLRGSLVSMRITERNRLGRASTLEVKGTAGTMTVKAIRLRDLLGTLSLRSTNFTLIQERNGAGAKFSFIGHGSGHGVGMCQWGAKIMGDRGHAFSEILKHYYPRATVAKLY